MDLNCRVCLQLGNVMVSVFERVDKFQMSLCNLLQIFGGLDIDKDDDFPKYLCEKCTQELLLAAEFRKKCKKSQELLMEMKYNNDNASNFNNVKDILTEDDIITNIEEEIVYEDDLTNEQILENELNTLETGSNIMDENDYVEEIVEPTEFNNEYEVETSQDINENDNDFMSNIVEEEIIAQNDSVNEEYFESNIEAEIMKEIVTEHNAYVEEADPNDSNFIDYDDIVEEVISENDELENEENFSDINYVGTVERDLSLEIEKLEKELMRIDRSEYKCHICGASYERAPFLKRHLETKHKFLITYCNLCKCMFVSKQNYKEHACLTKAKTKPERKPRKRTFIAPKKKRIRTYANLFHCQFCNKKMLSEFNLKMHHRLHIGDKPFQCNLCKNEFKSRAALVAHQSRHRDHKRHFFCPICQKGFSKESELRIHCRTNCGGNGYTCPICKKCFACTNTLQTHMSKRHNNVSEERLSNFDDSGSNTNAQNTEETEEISQGNLAANDNASLLADDAVDIDNLIVEV